jgi:purine-binding chemotaxis protein CheW
MSTATRQQQVLDQQLALSAYLDALLEDNPAAKTGPLAVDLVAKPSAPELVAPPIPIVAETAGTEEVAPQRPAVTSAVPLWAESRFQALLFEVAGLTLAVPLVKLKGVIPNSHGLTAMPGHAALLLGVTIYQGLQTRVVDTARLVLPDKLRERLSEPADARAAHLVVIDEGRWALACSHIGEVIELEAEGVKWRSASGKRLWLAGTVIEYMCALLDIDQLTHGLAEGMA